MIYELTKEHLTEDDLKVIKHLKAIDNLFKKGNLSICGLFATPDTIHVLKNVDGADYSVYGSTYIVSDGGDPDDYGDLGIHSASELEELYEQQEES